MKLDPQSSQALTDAIAAQTALRAAQSPAWVAPFTGCLLGTAVGDAVGLPYEGLSRRRAARMYPARDRVNSLPAAAACAPTIPSTQSWSRRR